MLPFLQPKRIASVISERRREDGSQKPAEKAEDQSLAKRLIDGIHSKDANEVAAVLKSLLAQEDQAEQEPEPA